MRRGRRFGVYSRRRLYLVVGTFGLAFLVILVRLSVVQVGQYAYWRDSAATQYGGRFTVSLLRGRIFDRRNDVLAASIPFPSVFAAPRDVREPGVTAQKITTVFPSLSRNRLERRLASDAPFVWLTRQVSPAKAAALEALELPGIHIRQEMRRMYPRGVSAGSAIGYTGVDEQGLGGESCAWPPPQRRDSGLFGGFGGAFSNSQDEVRLDHQPRRLSPLRKVACCVVSEHDDSANCC